MAIKFTKWPENWQNGHKIYQHLSLQDTLKFTQIGNFRFEHKPSGNPGAQIGKIWRISRRQRSSCITNKLWCCTCNTRSNLAVSNKKPRAINTGRIQGLCFVMRTFTYIQLIHMYVNCARLSRSWLHTTISRKSKTVFFPTGISDTVPRSFCYRQVATGVWHYYHHFPTLSLEHLFLSLACLPRPKLLTYQSI
jgi:hypothetical protein